MSKKTKNVYAKRAIDLHKKNKGKIGVASKVEVKNLEDLSVVYTPGVGAVSSEIAKHPKRVNELTWKKNTVAIVSDGTAVLGLGDIGPEAALPVMEGKSVIFKQFTNIDAIPIVLDTKDPEEIIQTVKMIAPTFGAIQLEDISAPRCFEIEDRLSKELSIPVMHDDQHGTAIVALAGLINALKIVKKDLAKVRIILSGAGAAGIAIAKLLIASGAKNLILCDSKGVIHPGRTDLNPIKKQIVKKTNPKKEKGSMEDVLKNADIFIGISKPGILTRAMVKTMAKDAIIFALSNPIPEIMPDEAKAGGARVIATGRSDFPNQINNALCYPGLFRGMLDKNINTVTDEIKIRAAKAIASAIKKPTPKRIVPTIFDKGLHQAVAKSVRKN